MVPARLRPLALDGSPPGIDDFLSGIGMEGADEPRSCLSVGDVVGKSDEP